MRICITGAAGFLGSNLVAQALQDGHTVSGVDDLSAGELGFLPKTFLDSLYVRDFADDELLSFVRLQRFDVVIHCAARPRVSWSVEHPYLSNETNVSKTVKLLEAAAGNVRRFVFV